MSKSLPPRPSLEQLRKQAKELLKALRVGEPEARELFQRLHSEASRHSASQFSEVTLSEAQHVLARDYGFATWAELKEQVESLASAAATPVDQLRLAFQKQDAATFGRVLSRHPELKARINDPVAAFDSPLVTQVKTREMLDVLLEAGADLNAKSRWWAGGFGLLHGAEPGLARYAIERGAIVDAHAAARLGLIDRLRELLTANPSSAHAPGGDGQTPLHFSSTVAIATLLLEHGANIDARDVDHESTPAQYMIRDRQEIVRFLIERGCHTDVFMGAALGDRALVLHHLESDPGCVRQRVDSEHFPMTSHRAGGTIYQWTLGWHVSPHEVARGFGHEEIYRLLLERSPAGVRLLVACWLGEEADVRVLLEESPGLAKELDASGRNQIAHAARNNNLAAVRMMLQAGLPVDALGQHRATPLHWSSFHGNVEMARAILAHQPPLEVTDADFQSTPLGWAMHGSENGWYCRTGDYPGTVEALLNAGAKLGDRPIRGTDAVQAVLLRATSP